MHKPESVLENETQKVLCDFKIQTDQLIPARRPDLRIINKKKRKKEKRKKNVLNSRLCRPSGQQSKIERKRKESQVLRPCQRTYKAMEHEVDGDTDYNLSAWNDQ